MESYFMNQIYESVFTTLMIITILYLKGDG